MNPFKFGTLLLLVVLFGTGYACAGEPALKQAAVIELANAAAKENGVTLADYSPPKVRYVRKDDSWSVHYQGRLLKPGGFFVVTVHDKAKKTKLHRGA